MSLSDPISDVLTRVRNAQMASHKSVSFPVSNVIIAIVEILKKEGFIEGFLAYKEDTKRFIRVELRYYEEDPVIRKIERVSSPGCRVYVKAKNIRPLYNNAGVSIFSTSRGVLSHKDALLLGVGGELLCRVF